MKKNDFFERLLNTTKIYYIVIFLTGAFSLIYQVIWQRYMSFLVGSEARSSTLVVAVFLFGLALGYYLFGILSTVVPKKQTLLKIYGYIEFLTGIYAIFFVKYFHFLNESTLAQSSSFFADLFMTILLIFPATILMGATIPIMTTVLPNNNKILNKQHAIIYGLNTVGAFLGVIIGSLYLMNHFGLEKPLIIIGIFNILASLIYIGNNLTGNIVKSDVMPVIKTNYSALSLYFLAFISGLTSISLEILWVRLWGLSIGFSYLVFPMVLSLFVLGLGIGSLTIKNISSKKLHAIIIWIFAVLFISFIVVPYLPIWTNQIRVLLVNHIANYYLYHVLIYLLLALFLLPLLIPMGKLLPIAYAMLPKNKNKYGLQCGFLYFFNTIGTFLGATLLSYYLLNFLSIPEIYKLNILLISLFFLYFLIKDKKYILCTTLLLCLLCLLPLLQWNRLYHVESKIRDTKITTDYFSDFFAFHPNSKETIYLEDGKNTTVAVTNSSETTPHNNLSVFVNGKCDSSTIHDYSTISLLGTLPYLYHEKTNAININIIGLGTGVTAGLLAQFKGIDHIDVEEISASVIKALPLFKDQTMNAHNNPKISIHEIDAFKFFKANKIKYDIIISEPSNPWVIGVENIYTPYFYRLTKKTLNKNGILAQWIHMYDFDKKNFSTIIKNLLDQYQHVELFNIFRKTDILILASDNKITASKAANKTNQKLIKEIFSKIDLRPGQIEFLHLYNTEELKKFVEIVPGTKHSIDFPSLASQAHKSFFLHSFVDLDNLLPTYLVRHLNSKDTTERVSLLEQAEHDFSSSSLDCSTDINEYYSYKCNTILNIVNKYRNYLYEIDLNKKLQAYTNLNNLSFIQGNPIFLKQIENSLLDKEKGSSAYKKQTFELLLNEFTNNGDFNNAYRLIEQVKKQDLFQSNFSLYSQLVNSIEKTKKHYLP